jgi:hypothetical protein
MRKAGREEKHFEQETAGGNGERLFTAETRRTNEESRN